jgi:hypothetical protein
MTETLVPIRDVKNLTRDMIVPYYAYMIRSGVDQDEVIRMNMLILSKWTSAGLEYIKNKAWKMVSI